MILIPSPSICLAFLRRWRRYWSDNGKIHLASFNPGGDARLGLVDKAKQVRLVICCFSYSFVIEEEEEEEAERVWFWPNVSF